MKQASPAQNTKGKDAKVQNAKESSTLDSFAHTESTADRQDLESRLDSHHSRETPLESHTSLDSPPKHLAPKPTTQGFSIPTLCLLYLVLPLLTGWFIYAIFTTSIPRNLPIGLVDFDSSRASREAIFSLNASPALHITQSYPSVAAAKEDLATARIYALVVIPRNYEKDSSTGAGAKLALYYNAQFVLIGKAINSALASTITTLNAKAWAGKNLIKDEVLPLALARSLPIFSQIIPLYNASSNYAQFLLTLLLPCMLQVLSALAMAQLLRNPPKNLLRLLSLYLCNSGVFVLWGLCMLLFLQALGYEARGSFRLLLGGVAMLVLAVNAVVVLLCASLYDLKKSLGFIAVYTAPSLAFAGVTYPQNSMPLAALLWSKCLPISHYMELFIQQANYGGSQAEGLKILAGGLWFLGFFALGALIYRLRMRPKPNEQSRIEARAEAKAELGRSL